MSLLSHDSIGANLRYFLFLPRVQSLTEGHLLNSQVEWSVLSFLLDKPFKQWRCLGFEDPFDNQEWLRISAFNLKFSLLFLVTGLVFSLCVFMGEIFFLKTRS